MPITRALWDSLDQAIFFTMNGWVAQDPFWQSFWAVANWRPFDLISASLILLLSFAWIYRSVIEVRLQILSGLALLLIIILATRFSSAFLLYLTEYQRYSPSITLEPSYRLNTLVSWIETKDYHKDCFPGDHGYVVISCIVFFFLQAGRHWGLLALLLFSPFMLPRLVSGAHWATDILIGSVTMALISMPLLFATPLYRTGQNLLTKILYKLFKPLLKVVKLAI